MSVWEIPHHKLIPKNVAKWRLRCSMSISNPLINTKGSAGPPSNPASTQWLRGMSTGDQSQWTMDHTCKVGGRTSINPFWFLRLWNSCLGAPRKNIMLLRVQLLWDTGCLTTKAYCTTFPVMSPHFEQGSVPLPIPFHFSQSPCVG